MSSSKLEDEGSSPSSPEVGVAEFGRRVGLKIRYSLMNVRVQVPSPENSEYSLVVECWFVVPEM